MKNNPTILIAYIPVLHQGYLNLIAKYPSLEKILLITKELLPEDNFLRKDIRALSGEQQITILQTLFPDKKIALLTEGDFAALKNTDIVMPDEDHCHELAERYVVDAVVIFDSSFLRWDRKNSVSEKTVSPDQKMSWTEFDEQMIHQASELTHHSSDWWRQVGAVLVKDGQVVLEDRNRHVPTDLEPYFNGDPRANFHKGEHIYHATALHAEASLIAQAAAVGISTNGTSLYVTTFPCPYCAKLVAYSGVKKLFFSEGYALVDGEDILKERGVEIIQVTS